MENNEPTPITRPQNGLKNGQPVTRRDYFAAAALQALIGCTHPAQRGVGSVAEQAYHFADAMIEAAKADQ